MPSASIKKIILCNKDNLISMVLDIEKYPKFIPWCVNAKVYKTKDEGNIIKITADLTIGKSFFYETYKSFVIYNKSEDSILVTNIDGPLKHLENKWFFKELGNNCEIDFYIDFELESKVLNLLMAKSFNMGLTKIVSAFEKRAIDLFKRA